MLNGLYVMDLARFPDVYGDEERAAIEQQLQITAPPLAPAELTPALLADVDVLVTAWGGPQLTAELLAFASRLQLVLYGAGSVRSIVTPESWARGIRVTTANEVIAASVAEFTLAQVLYALKHGWRYVLGSRARHESLPRASNEPGADGSVVGLMSLGATGRATARLLGRHELTLQAYDPYVDPAVAADLGVRLVSLEELFATSDVVSLHAPVLPDTRKVVSAELLGSMKHDATLINTARGALIDEDALVSVLQERLDLFAVLDVTDPEPPLPGSPLFSLPNAVVTPHLAGTLNTERRRQGRLMAEELARFLAGEPLQHEVFESTQARSA
ncbi:D-isomer specific 2-hydroxyacid dehydrogenase NAD-binding protein [Kribbella flavida DSM 17836]|uniref:D-isomer specific 2-hydroxyacid dehydrogenase NAD-binding protein n=1 Tax=Kribbella flavida (strain DSM 17836 / JCM 10339 / NBRC 14399) TaxID=479435 RepID=D2PZZ4_KRIFD|nr:hydroxyacid dehydrogenase [Kribbella flavida]ADB29992.1 D-isomer specific 2-hydroxyacid dehydrogenase NAD-binding protein [Kribbella flavida DSM 17836]